MSAQHCRTLKMDAGRMIKAMGLSAPDDLETIVADINRRNNEAVVSQIHRMPPKTSPDEPRPRGRKAKKLKDIAEGRRPAGEEPKPKGMRGRPKGSRNKTSAPKAEAMAHGQKRGPGRPKGSTKKKSAKGRESNDAPRKGPGRPKGSKNKKTLLMEAKQVKREKRKGKDST